MTQYELIIFDIDGTLLDTEKGIVHAAEEALQQLNITGISRSDIKSCIGPPLAKTMVEKGFLKKEEFSTFNDTFRSLYKDKYLMDATLYPNVVKMLSLLKGKKKIAVATNKRFDYTNTLLEKFGVSPYCDVIHGTDFEGKLNKYDLIMACLRETNTEPQNAVMIGDTTSDSNAAKKANVQFIGVTYGFGFKDKSENKMSADTIDELIEMIL